MEEEPRGKIFPFYGGAVRASELFTVWKIQTKEPCLLACIVKIRYGVGNMAKVVSYLEEQRAGVYKC